LEKLILFSLFFFLLEVLIMIILLPSWFIFLYHKCLSWGLSMGLNRSTWLTACCIVGRNLRKVVQHLQKYVYAFFMDSYVSELWSWCIYAHKYNLFEIYYLLCNLLLRLGLSWKVLFLVQFVLPTWEISSRFLIFQLPSEFEPCTRCYNYFHKSLCW